MAIYILTLNQMQLHNSSTALPRITSHSIAVSYDGSKTAAGVIACLDGSCHVPGGGDPVASASLTASAANPNNVQLGARYGTTHHYLKGGLVDVWVFQRPALNWLKRDRFFAAGAQQRAGRLWGIQYEISNTIFVVSLSTTSAILRAQGSDGLL